MENKNTRGLQRPAPRLGRASELSVFFPITSSHHSRQFLKPGRKVFSSKPSVGGAKSSGSLGADRFQGQPRFWRAGRLWAPLHPRPRKLWLPSDPRRAADCLYKESAGGSLANGFLHAQARSRIQWDERESSPVGGRGFRRGRGVAQPHFTG